MSIKTQAKRRLGDMIIIPKYFWRTFPKSSIVIQSLVFQTVVASPLGVLDHLHVGASSGRSRLELGIVPGHGW